PTLEMSNGTATARPPAFAEAPALSVRFFQTLADRRRAEPDSETLSRPRLLAIVLDLKHLDSLVRAVHVCGRTRLLHGKDDRLPETARSCSSRRTWRNVGAPATIHRQHLQGKRKPSHHLA